MDASWLAKYPKAAALLQGADDELLYAPQSASGPDDGPETPPEVLAAAQSLEDVARQLCDLIDAEDRDQERRAATGRRAPIGVMAADYDAGATFHHDLPAPPLAPAILPTRAELRTIEVCTTFWPMPVCTCGAWRLVWHGGPRP